MFPTYQNVLCEAADGVAVVTLNRPERRNAIGGDMFAGLYEILRRIADSDEIRVVVLTGAGGNFCVGADAKNKSDGVKGGKGFRDLWKLYHSATLLHAMPQTTIAAIDGGCAGAGLGWACACDFRFASERAVFSSAFMRIGVAGDMGIAWSLMQAVGASRARELLYFPEKFAADMALQYGLVTRIFGHEQLLAEARTAAGILAASSAFALRAVKANFLSAERLSLAEFIEVESARHMHVVVSDEATEGFRAFAEKRPPRFR